jgi:hypothetical protein
MHSQLIYEAQKAIIQERLERASRMQPLPTSQRPCGRRGRRRVGRRLAIAAAAAIVGLAIGTGTAAAAGGGNSAAAQACQQGGWKQLATGSSGSFANAGDCASYAAQGGTFGATAPFLTLTSVSGNLVDFSGGGLEPSAPVYVCDGILDPTSCSDQISDVLSDGTFVGNTSCSVGEFLETSTADGAVIDSNAVTACI